MRPEVEDMADRKTPETDAGRSPVVIAVAALIGALSAGFLLLYVAVALARLRYPFELQWGEGLILDHVRRVVAGLPLYPPPSLDFLAVLYLPFYYYVAAIACRALGDGFAPLRLVSLIASLGCFGLIFEIVRREKRGALWALFAAGFFAATYRACGDWLDVARVDSLFLLFFLAAVALVRFGESAAAGVAAGLLAAVATLTKQTTLPAIAPILCWVVVVRRRRALPLLATYFAALAAAAAALDRASGGWVWRYCFVIPAQQPFNGHPPWAFWTEFVLGQTPVAAVAVAAHLVAGRRRATTWFYAALLAGTGGISWLTYTKAQGAENDFLTAAAAMAIVAALGFADAAKRFSETAPRRRLAAAAIGAACLVQFALLRYDAAAQVPRLAAAAAGARLLQTLRAFPGEVFIPAHGYLGPFIGKRSYSHVAIWQDIFLTPDTALRRTLAAEITAAFDRGRFDAIVLDGLQYPYLQVILTRYRYMGELFRKGETDGFRVQAPWPNFLFVRNDLVPPGR